MLGVAGKGKPGQNLTDTIMIASINPKTNQVALLSIPRDLYVTIPGNNARYENKCRFINTGLTAPIMMNKKHLRCSKALSII